MVSKIHSDALTICNAGDIGWFTRFSNLEVIDISNSYDISGIDISSRVTLWCEHPLKII